MKSSTFTKTCISLALTIAVASVALAQEINLYSARHYSTDERLYSNFTKQTGIKINRIEADDNSIMSRLASEGKNSPADVILLVDAARLYKGEVDQLFLPIRSKVLESSIPANLRSAPNQQGEISWFGLSTRARIVVYDKIQISRSDVDTYEKLADPKLKGKLCTRSGAHPYNVSLFGSVYEHLGAEKTEAWLKGLVANMARDPKGGDTDQIKSVASGECAIAITNSYYMARLIRSSNPADRAISEKVGIVFPNQQSWGTHVNVAGGAIAKNTKNKANAIQFLEYLASPEAQKYFAEGNNELPVVAGVEINNPALKAMARNGFKSETIPISAVGKNQSKIIQMLDRVGFK